MNHTHHSSGAFLLDAIFGVCSVLFISITQIETTLFLSAIGGIFSVICGGIARYLWYLFVEYWRKIRNGKPLEKLSKKQLIAKVKELEAENKKLYYED
jgi:hypothetical protein